MIGERVYYMASSILKTEKLCKSFSNGGVMQHVIKNLDLEIMEGDFTVIMGSSGSGKSTLLYALSGMDKPSMGKVIFDGTEIQDKSNDELATFRRGNCGFVFQSIYLLENQTVLDNVLTGALIVQKNSPELVNKAKELLKCTAKRSSEISIEVGYKDPHYFSYLFKKTQGMTPTQFRGGKGSEEDWRI